MTTVRLPFPVTANRRITKAHKSGRVILTETYRSWLKEAGQEIMVQRAKPVAGEVAVRVELVPPDARKRDADNTLKCVLDALVANHVIEDDSNKIVREINVEWVSNGHPCVVHVLPYGRPF